MTVRELKDLVAGLNEGADVLTSGVEVAQAVLTREGTLILEMDPEYNHEGLVLWRDLDG